MNRRNFITTLFGASLAPVAVAKVLSTSSKSNDDMLSWYKGTEFYRSGVADSQYIPLNYTYDHVEAIKLNLKNYEPN